MRFLSFYKVTKFIVLSGVVSVCSVRSEPIVINADVDANLFSYLEKHEEAYQTQFKNKITELEQVIGSIQEYAVQLELLSYHPVNIKGFIVIYSDYKKNLNEARKLIMNLPLLPAKVLPADMNEVDSEQINTFLTEIGHSYDQICTQIEKKQNALNFSLILPDGDLYSHQGDDLTPLKKLNLFTAQEIMDMRSKAEKLLVMKTADRLKVDQGYNAFTISKFKTFIDSFGSTQKHRYKNETLFTNAMNDLEETFWSRSYLRAVFGRPLGSFGVNHKKRKAHLDLFASKDLAILADVIRNNNELRKLQDLCYSALQGQTNEDLKSLKLSGPVFTLVTIPKSIYSFFAGDQQLREVNSVLLKFMVADIEEELLLSQAGGLKMLRQHYKNRWHKDFEHQDKYKALEDKYLGDNNDDDYEADINIISSDTLRGVFNLAVKALENQEDRTNEANKILNTIDQLTSDNKQKINRKKRRKII